MGGFGGGKGVTSVLVHRGGPDLDEPLEDARRRPPRTRAWWMHTRKRALATLALACVLALGGMRALGVGLLERARALDGSEPFLALLRRQRDGTIAVVVPCHNQRAFIGETLRSLVAQTFPPASIIVVDDASPDGCAAEAERLLAELHPQRAAQRAALAAWLGLAPDALAALADEVLVTEPPARGVAAARNRALRRASAAAWVSCVDADDLLAPRYFELAMREVAAAPALNLVFANQQFFGESTWRWDVPEWTAQAAVASGPLPVSSLLRRGLWAATPNGFDEAQPRGHEDWSLWLQLARLPVRARKLDGWLLLYRYRQSSKMRTRERRNPEVVRLLRTLYPDLYPTRTLLDDHAALVAGGLTAEVLADARAARARMPTRSQPALWLGLHAEAKGELALAAAEYAAARALRADHDWQPLLRQACLAARTGDERARAQTCRELRALWGGEQARWYLAADSPATTLPAPAAGGDGAVGASCCPADAAAPD